MYKLYNSIVQQYIRLPTSRRVQAVQQCSTYEVACTQYTVYSFNYEHLRLREGLYRVYNSIFYYLRAVVYKLYNSIAQQYIRLSTSRRVQAVQQYCTYEVACTQYKVYSFSYEHLCTQCTTFDNGVYRVYSVFAQQLALLCTVYNIRQRRVHCLQHNIFLLKSWRARRALAAIFAASAAAALAAVKPKQSRIGALKSGRATL